MKKLSLYASGFVGLLAAIAFVFAFSPVEKAEANPIFFPASATTNNAASTSPVFMQAATASTSVIYYDSYYVNTQSANTKALDAALTLRLSATSTSAVFNIWYEYSQGQAGYNCTTQPTFCEWYEDNYTQSSTGYPSSVDLTLGNIKFVRTLAAGTTTKIFNIPMPTRYVRVNAKLTGAPGNVWGEVIPNKEMK